MSSWTMALSSVERIKQFSCQKIKFIPANVQNINRNCIFSDRVLYSFFVFSPNAYSNGRNLSILNIASPAPVPFVHLKTENKNTIKNYNKRTTNEIHSRFDVKNGFLSFLTASLTLDFSSAIANFLSFSFFSSKF